MRIQIITPSIHSHSNAYTTDRCVASVASLGNALRGVLGLTFMRERTGYEPEPGEPKWKRQSPRVGSWSLQPPTDFTVRCQGSANFKGPACIHRLVHSAGLMWLAITAKRFVPLATQPIRLSDVGRLDLVRAEQHRRLAIR